VPDLDKNDLQALHKRLEEHGVETVRALLASDSFPPTHKLEIARWLARQASAGADAKTPSKPRR
jgi:hypothetical protein